MTSNETFLTSNGGGEVVFLLLTVAYSLTAIVNWFRTQYADIECDRWDIWNLYFSFGFILALLAGYTIAGVRGILAVGIIGSATWVIPVLFYSFTRNGSRRNVAWILLLVVAYFITWSSPTFGPTASGGRAVVTRANGELRSVATAMYDYQTHHGEFPTSLGQLTTPLEFIVDLPHDPFHWPAKEYPEGDPYNLIVSSDRQAFVVYSFGMDFDDDKATVRYSPTNGTVSNGDIIRWTN